MKMPEPDHAVIERRHEIVAAETPPALRICRLLGGGERRQGMSLVSAVRGAA